jgi:4-amino-4-deoxy-L-arabinose transferase-like glycosyltransferase
MAVTDGQVAAGRAPLRRQSRPRATRWHVWRSPPDQPRWARPALLAISSLAALAYAWGADSAALEPFYGAAARSMSTSWHDFLFGAFDPAGTVTVDKLPGALWPQALSLRIFGFHIWAVVLPQILEGVLTILVLYRAVRRLAGPVAGIAAVAILAASPVTVALNRGNVSDSLLILLTVLAADATARALSSGRLRPLLLAGVWVGLAFQAKMLQAWLILPALAAAYLLAAPPRLRTRLGHLLIAGAITAIVSLSWMTAVSLVPAHERPYVDGTQNDSLFSQVFDYNGIARLGGGRNFAGEGTPAEFLLKVFEASPGVDSLPESVGPSWHRLLGDLFGQDDGWLLPAALIAAGGVLVARRGTGRRDPLRASVVLWGTWLTVLAVFFSMGSEVHSYYVAALSPAIAGLCGTGAGLAWQRRRQTTTRAVLSATLLASVGYGIYLLSEGANVPRWLAPLAACLGACGALAILASQRRAGSSFRAGPRFQTGLVAAAMTCALLLPAVTSALVAARGHGPFFAPYQRASPAAESESSARQERAGARADVDQISATFHTPIVFAADSSTLAARYILATGREVLPIGGYKGGIPTPSLRQLQRYIASGQLRGFLIPTLPVSRDPRIAWIRTHCSRASPSEGPIPQVKLALFQCTDRDLRGR